VTDELRIPDELRLTDPSRATDKYRSDERKVGGEHEADEYSEFSQRNGWGPGQPLQRWFSRRLLSEFLRVTSVTPADTRLLEVGCGLGNTGVAAKAMGFRSYTAVEPNPVLAQAARERIAPDPVVEARLPELTPDLRNSSDVALAIHVIEHATSGYEAREWVSGLANTVRQDGYVLVVSPDVRDFKTSFWDIDWSHAFPTTTNNLSQIMTDLDLKVVCAKRLRMGTLKALPNFLALVISMLLPTRVLDAVSRRFVGRNLATGFKTTALWGVAFIVAQKQAPRAADGRANGAART
jgi:SAM-dependent methyltransferase